MSVTRAAWSAPTSPEVVARRAGGRSRYNKERQARAAARRVLIWHEFGSDLLRRRRVVGDISRAFGISRSTARRDCARLAESQVPCPVCGGPVPWDVLASSN